MLKIINSIKIVGGMVSADVITKLDMLFEELNMLQTRVFSTDNVKENLFPLLESKHVYKVPKSFRNIYIYIYKRYISEYWLSKMGCGTYEPRIKITPIILSKGVELKFTVDMKTKINPYIIFNGIEENTDIFIASAFFIRKENGAYYLELYKDIAGDVDVLVNFLYYLDGTLLIPVTQWENDTLIERKDFRLNVEENNSKAFRDILKYILAARPISIHTQRLVPYDVLQGKKVEESFSNFNIEEYVIFRNDLWELYGLIEAYAHTNNIMVRSNKGVSLFQVCPKCLSKQSISDYDYNKNKTIDILFNAPNKVQCSRCKSFIERDIVEPLTLHEVLKRDYSF